jgi:acyl carrier protein
MENTFEIVKAMIVKKLALIQPESTLTDVGLDSLDTFDIIFDAEDKFGIKVPNDQVNVSTIQDVADLFDKLLAENNTAAK